MPDRAGIFEGDDDFDISSFTPKKPARQKEAAPPAADAVRVVSEASNFRSREPLPPAVKVQHRRHRTGRNLQLNLKVAAETYAAFYQIADSHGWVLGETLERAVAALKRELAAEYPSAENPA